MSGPSATCYKRSGTSAHFYSRKGAWKHPVEIHGPVPPEDVQPGYKYEFDFDVKPIQITAQLGRNDYFEKDCREHGIDLEQAPVTQAARGGAISSGPALTERELMINATGVVKSAIEKGEKFQDAAHAGLIWAQIWGKLPSSAEAWLNQAKPPRTTPAANGDPDDDINF